MSQQQQQKNMPSCTVRGAMVAAMAAVVAIALQGCDASAAISNAADKAATVYADKKCDFPDNITAEQLCVEQIKAQAAAASAALSEGAAKAAQHVMTGVENGTAAAKSLADPETLAALAKAAEEKQQQAAAAVANFRNDTRVQSFAAQAASQATAAQAAVSGYMAPGGTTMAPAAAVAAVSAAAGAAVAAAPLYAPTAVPLTMPYTTAMPTAMPFAPAAPARLFQVSDSAAISPGSANTGAFLAVSAAFLLGTGAVAIAIRRVRAPETNYDEEQLVLAEEGLE